MHLICNWSQVILLPAINDILFRGIFEHHTIHPLNIYRRMLSTLHSGDGNTIIGNTLDIVKSGRGTTTKHGLV